MARFSITVPDDVAETLRLVAAADSRSVSNLIASILGDLAPMLSQVVQARTAEDLGAYLGGLLDDAQRASEAARVELGKAIDDRYGASSPPALPAAPARPPGPRRRRRPPASNTGVSQ